MDPGHAKILNKPEKGDTRRMKKPAAEHVSKTVSETESKYDRNCQGFFSGCIQEGQNVSELSRSAYKLHFSNYYNTTAEFVPLSN